MNNFKRYINLPKLGEFSRFDSWFNEFDKIFEKFNENYNNYNNIVGKKPEACSTCLEYPKTNIYTIIEDKKEFICADFHIPYMKKEDIVVNKIITDEGMRLKIKGQSRPDDKISKTFINQIPRRAFVKEVLLPLKLEDINEGSFSSKIDNGVLSIRMSLKDKQSNRDKNSMRVAHEPMTDERLEEIRRGLECGCYNLKAVNELLTEINRLRASADTLAQ